MMAQTFITRRKGGGGVNKDLPAQITAFTATADSTPSVTLNWVNPTEYWAGTLIVKKAGSAPEGVNDGKKVYKGEGTSYTDFDVSFDTEYFYRAFPFNAKKQYQTVENVVSAKPVSGIALSELAEGALVNIMEDGVASQFYLFDHNFNSALNGEGRVLLNKAESAGSMKWNSGTTSTYAKYANSTVDTWQNNTYKAKFSDAVQTMMATTSFEVTYPSGQTLSRSIFILLNAEWKQYKALVASGRYNMWFRDSGYDSDAGQAYALAIYGSGGSYVTGGKVVTSTYSVYPCFTLPATALVNPTPNPDGSYTLIEAA